MSDERHRVSYRDVNETLQPIMREMRKKIQVISETFSDNKVHQYSSLGQQFEDDGHHPTVLHVSSFFRISQYGQLDNTPTKGGQLGIMYLNIYIYCIYIYISRFYDFYITVYIYIYIRLNVQSLENLPHYSSSTQTELVFFRW